MAALGKGLTKSDYALWGFFGLRYGNLSRLMRREDPQGSWKLSRGVFYSPAFENLWENRFADVRIFKQGFALNRYKSPQTVKFHFLCSNVLFFPTILLPFLPLPSFSFLPFLSSFFFFFSPLSFFKWKVAFSFCFPWKWLWTRLFLIVMILKFRAIHLFIYLFAIALIRHFT